MSLEEFLEALREVKRLHAPKWELVQPPNNQLPWIRFHLPNGNCYCPVTAVAYFHQQVDYPTAGYGRAAEALDLSLHTANCIVAAADGYSDFTHLRAELIAILQPEYVP